MIHSRITQKIFLSLFLAAVVFAIWQSQAWFRSAILFEQSQLYQEAWTSSPETLTAENWQSAGQDLFSALSLNEGSSIYLHQYGLLLDSERSLIDEELSPELRQEAQQQILANAIEAHRLGIRQQPASPFGWAYFARAKALAGQFDGAFDLALERINTLGPWEKEIHQTVAGISRYYWPDLSETGRYYAVSLLQRALSNPSYDQAALAILQDSEFLSLQLCPALDFAALTDTARSVCQ